MAIAPWKLAAGALLAGAGVWAISRAVKAKPTRKRTPKPSSPDGFKLGDPPPNNPPEAGVAATFETKPTHLETDGYQIFPLSRQYTPPGGSYGMQPDPYPYIEWHLAALGEDKQAFNQRYVGLYHTGTGIEYFVLAKPAPGIELFRQVRCVHPNGVVEIFGTGGSPEGWAAQLGAQCSGELPVEQPMTAKAL